MMMTQRIHPKIIMRGFKPGGRGAGHVLGELETAVMEILWRAPGQTVNEVEEHLRQRRGSAHTTVLTTLDRLHRKGYLLREKLGKAFVYTPRYTLEEFERMMAQEVLGALIGHSAENALSTFVDLIGNEPGALDQLEAKIREKRRQRPRK
ncbi:MAG: BlaI/MecI/CopY family transcriptional regulator [Acidobacteriota bacterium]|nr:BlaI/MecI/CopY family transcriptional regulator [Acidobacteriota bacterium]